MKKIEILKLPPYSYPERISSSHLTEDLNKAFGKSGFHTTAYAPNPCRGIDETIRRKYKKIPHEKLEDGSIDLYRFPLFKEGKSPVRRALRYIICNIIQYRKGKKVKDVDVVFAGSTPPTQGLLCGSVAKSLSKKYGYHVPFLYHLQDVFPDTLVTSGLISKESIIWKIARIIEDKTYKLSDKIIVISDEIKANIISKGVPENKVIVIPNWIDTNEIKPIPREDNNLFEELGILRSRFIVVYAGNIGELQGLDALIEAAKIIKEVEFIIFGEGCKKEEYVKNCEKIHNIHFYPLLGKSRISEVYSMGDLCYVGCKKGTGYGAFPSKTYSIMAAGTPILLNFDKDTTLWNMVEKNKSGICTKVGDINDLVSAIRMGMENKDYIESLGKNSRLICEKRYDKEHAVLKIVNLVKSLVNSKRKDYC